MADAAQRTGAAGFVLFGQAGLSQHDPANVFHATCCHSLAYQPLEIQRHAARTDRIRLRVEVT